MSKKGFTLIELLVVVAVLALLASIVFSNLGGAREGARISNALSFQSQTHSLLGSDLMGWWNFNDPDDRYKDISGYDNHGSCTSCPTIIDGVPGTGGSGMEFSEGDSVEIRDLNFTPGGGNEISVGAWIKPSASTDERAPIARIDRWFFQVYQDNRLATYWYGRSPAGYHYSTVNSIPMDEWFHVAVMWSTSDVKFYINGQLDTTISAVGGTGDANTWINFGYENTGRRYKGIIDDVRIYNRTLTASEIQTFYAQTKDKYLAKERQ